MGKNHSLLHAEHQPGTGEHHHTILRPIPCGNSRVELGWWSPIGKVHFKMIKICGWPGYQMLRSGHHPPGLAPRVVLIRARYTVIFVPFMGAIRSVLSQICPPRLVRASNRWYSHDVHRSTPRERLDPQSGEQYLYACIVLMLICASSQYWSMCYWSSLPLNKLNKSSTACCYNIQYTPLHVLKEINDTMTVKYKVFNAMKLCLKVLHYFNHVITKQIANWKRQSSLFIEGQMGVTWLKYCRTCSIWIQYEYNASVQIHVTQSRFTEVCVCVAYCAIQDNINIGVSWQHRLWHALCHYQDMKMEFSFSNISVMSLLLK